ncbi:protein adenylyltransferase SelO [Gloeobacter kilaueensis]|uniref:Protein nucleotidyltransferase YdiU n=1 Tax=Gloeobacter kilaueensis (strain ATCC BAA-2537 / CCAP 1431/1 / ULC 316 / JS1) TaxID=1183438 RepID=U5QCQ2_GLOK1|nr:YdiU family protein [Gloeobacter kilaueensis]AGY56656.1 hypothetical protein GKIL_0410 [Gloeobacter kilaueensis JS1]
MQSDPPLKKNPLLALPFEPALASLGEDYYDVVAAAEFPVHHLRFRNDALLPLLNLDPAAVSDADFIEAFGHFEGQGPFFALRYHGYQFGEYNPFLGDGRGFLYGQVRGRDGELYDLGTKGSGTTPYSRGGDGRLTLKGGVREVLAAEALQALGVRTSRTLSLIETGERLWRGDEPSPTRSSVMVRLSRSHIRFGTFERLHYLGRKDLIRQLLDHVIACYYRPLVDEADRDALFYEQLVERVAELAAQWMAAGFTHAVLNTDNMSITGESFDYGPYAFIDLYDPDFTAAYFDPYGRYSYGNQPLICKVNLEALQIPLETLIPGERMQASLGRFQAFYERAYSRRMLAKLGFEALEASLAKDVLASTLAYLQAARAPYHAFFLQLSRNFCPDWSTEAESILPEWRPAAEAEFLQWRTLYQQALQTLPPAELDAVAERLREHNPSTVLLRPQIENVWAAISENDDWEPFLTLVERLQDPFDPPNTHERQR